MVRIFTTSCPAIVNADYPVCKLLKVIWHSAATGEYRSGVMDYDSAVMIYAPKLRL